MKIYCVRLPRLAVLKTKVGLGVLFAFTTAVLAGCGGGGGGGGSSSGGGTTSTTQTFSGTATDTTISQPAAGFTVRFDSSGPKTTTSSTGTFSLTIPDSSLTGSDTLYLLDSTNTVVGSTPITQEVSGESNISITDGPPLPSPPLDIHS